MEKNILNTIYGKIDLSSAWMPRDTDGSAELELGIYFNIADLSEDVKAEIAKAIEEQKASIEERYKDLLAEKGKHWCGDGKTLIYDSMYLHLCSGEPPMYHINATYVDSMDEHLELHIGIELDMTKYNDDFKEVVMEQIAGELFGW